MYELLIVAHMREQEFLREAQRLRLAKEAARWQHRYQWKWLASIGHWMIARGRALLAQAGETDRLPPSDWTYNPT